MPLILTPMDAFAHQKQIRNAPSTHFVRGDTKNRRVVQIRLMNG